MKLFALLFIFPFVSFAAAGRVQRIAAAARRDGINIYTLPTADSILSSIAQIDRMEPPVLPPGSRNGNKIDVHCRSKSMSFAGLTVRAFGADLEVHVIPPWYRDLVPLTGGSPTPVWTLQEQLEFMGNNSIQRAVMSISSPGSTVFADDSARSAALARLLNEYLAALSQKLPKNLAFYSVTPLPYTAAAIKEADYALNTLGAAGVGLLSNHEGCYLGNSSFRGLFEALNSRGSSTPVFVHPTDPCLHTANGDLTSADPTVYPSGLVEYYFETARTFMDLTISGTITSFPNLRFIVPHGGGAFPAMQDRFLTSQPPAIQAGSRDAFNTRFFWDVAGPVFPHQIQGLLGYGVPTSQLVYGSDFPYAPSFTYGLEIAAVENATFLDESEKDALFNGNASGLLHF